MNNIKNIDYSHEMSCFIFLKINIDAKKVSSAVVMIGASRVHNLYSIFSPYPATFFCPENVLCILHLLNIFKCKSD